MFTYGDTSHNNCWALLFILKLRFPPGQSLVDILKVHTYSARFNAIVCEVLHGMYSRIFQDGYI